jgi:deazaflavin-dependent oxidoreductase (nitroreductase family)
VIGTLHRRASRAEELAIPGRTRRPASTLASIETEFFRMLNRLAEPRIRAGCASPRLAPGGFVVLEITGRKTGRTSRVPLAATRIQDHVVVSTFRGRRSQWVRNLLANPEVRVWTDGRARRARAFVLAPDHRPRASASLPAALRWALSFLAPYTYAGWAFAVLAPLNEPASGPRGARGHPRPGSPRRASTRRAAGRARPRPRRAADSSRAS